MVRPSDEGVVRGHAESEMIKSCADWVERLTCIHRVLVDVDAEGVIERNHRASEAELINRVGGKKDDASQDVAVEIDTSTQIPNRDSVVMELNHRRSSRNLSHRPIIAGTFCPSQANPQSARSDYLSPRRWTGTCVASTKRAVRNQATTL